MPETQKPVQYVIFITIQILSEHAIEPTFQLPGPTSCDAEGAFATFASSAKTSVLSEIISRRVSMAASSTLEAAVQPPEGNKLVTALLSSSASVELSEISDALFCVSNPVDFNRLRRDAKGQSKLDEYKVARSCPSLASWVIVTIQRMLISKFTTSTR